MSRLIGTVVIGEEYEALAEHTVPLMCDYAERVGAKPLTVTARHMDKRLPVIFEKWQIARMLEHYDRVMIVDADMVIMPECPDLFEVVPPKEFGGYDEPGHPAWGEEFLFTAMHGCHQAIRRKNPGEPAPLLRDWRWNRAYLNAGLWVLGKAHLPLFRDPLESLADADFLCPEQTWMNFLLSREGTPIHRLPEAYNCMTHHPDWDELRAYCYHVTMWDPPDGDRLGTIRRLAEEARHRKGGA